MEGVANHRKPSFRETVRRSVPKTHKEVRVTSDVRNSKKIMSANIVNGTVSSKQSIDASKTARTNASSRVTNKHVPGRVIAESRVGDDVGRIVTQFQSFSLNECSTDTGGEWNSWPAYSEPTWKTTKTIDAKHHTSVRQSRTLQELLVRTIQNGPQCIEQLSFTKEDIDVLPHIEPNKTKGPISSIQDYVRVQFNLLLYDFVRPLKDGIEILKTSNQLQKKQKLTQLKVFNNAKFTQYDVKRNKFGITVTFNQKTFSHSSDFFDSSLLIFSKDNFENYFFATVIDYSCKGKVTVKLFEDSIQDLMSSEFTMVESDIFFPPYLYVMQALTRLTEENFPMKHYIVDVNHEILPPMYLRGTTRKVCYDIDKYKVPVGDSAFWPDAQELGMDASQYLAFRSALTQEFAVIQGPPGTGKTYLGLQVAKVLINNADVWNNDHRPILVVCFTNHALDQFLEGLVTLTTEVIRVGGQSKSTILQPYNLWDKKKNLRLFGLGSVRKTIAGEMEVSTGIMQRIENDLTFLRSDVGVISLNYFKQKEIISDQHACCFDTVATNLILQETKNKNLELESTFLRWIFKDPTNTEGLYKCKEIPKSSAREKMTDLEYLYDRNLIKTVSEVEIKLRNIEENMRVINVSNKHPHQKRMMCSLEESHESYARSLGLLNTFLAYKPNANSKQIQRLLSVRNLWHLGVFERWTLYRYWVDEAVGNLMQRRALLMRELQDSEKKYEDAKILDDVDVLQSSLIVGMTTTGAAKNQLLLQKLKPRIVIVEEAAEVLESHIIASLTRFCEHLILIGDHQQLRPNINVHELRLRFGFDISLFERMVNNKVPSAVLQVQHRMRPEIACLIHPVIYPNLKNHPSVYRYPDVRGITANVYFINHSVPEDKMTDNVSRLNLHEARFLIRLCRYIVMQGYATSQVTILSMYKAQVTQLIKERAKYDMISDVRISTVDDYQGEENTIILLSLVRSNKEANVGFLKTKNRICVALSRAREGLYIIGNMENLARNRGSIWINIQKTLEQQEALGESLTLRCQRHPRILTVVRTAKDFSAVPEGGCSRQCEIPLTCGHSCTHKCHVLDAEHKDRYKCVRACAKVICKGGHACTKLCWMECDRECQQHICQNYERYGPRSNYQPASPTRCLEPRMYDNYDDYRLRDSYYSISPKHYMEAPKSWWSQLLEAVISFW